MKRIVKQIIISIFLTTSSYTIAITQSKNKDQMENSKLYHFTNYYLNLDSFEKIDSKNNVQNDFKTTSLFHYRFSNPIWFKTYPTQVSFNNVIFSINKEGKLELKSSSVSKQIENKEQEIPLSNTSGNNFLLATSTGVVHIKKLDTKHGYYIVKYDEKGKELFEIRIEHTKIIKKENTYYHTSYLNFFSYTDKWLVFTSYNREYPCTQLINLIDGKLTTLSFTINGIIQDENEKSITDLIKIIDNYSFQKINNVNQKPEWGKKTDYYLSDSDRAETLLKDDILVICFYNPISTGSSLYSYNKNTGDLLWKADVKQLMVPHSEYYNSVIISLYKNKIIMEGIEAGGNYLQIFDTNTGKRLYSSF